MINVLIVEDELSALERISSFGLWKNSGLRLASTARNGRQALDKLKTLKIDLIITDIEMPVMNGIEMIRELRKTRPALPVIILSCHESFEYAREAVSLGVSEYILKDFMEEDAVRLALSKAAPVKKEPVQLDRKAGGASGEAESRELLRAVVRKPPERGPELERFRTGPNTLIYIHLDGFSITEHDPQRLGREIEHDVEVFESEGFPAVSVYADGGNFWVMVKEEGLRFGESFFDRMKNRKNTFTVAIGDSFTGIENLHESAEAVKALFSYRVFLGKNRIILPKTIAGITGRSPAYIRKKISALKKAVYEQDSTVSLSILRELYERDLPGMLKYNYLEYVNLRLLSFIVSLSEKGRINLRELTGVDYISIKELEEKETVGEMRQWFEDLFHKIFNTDDFDAGVTNNNILKVINIIKTRFDEELSLEDIADEIGVHKVYLSRLFKKEAGRNYYDYLQSYRIGRAKFLLADENLRISEVAHKAGFKNYDQFAVVFRKLEGSAPSEYRKTLTDK